jgi:hypothetical protein
MHMYIGLCYQDSSLLFNSTTYVTFVFYIIDLIGWKVANWWLRFIMGVGSTGGLVVYM